MDSLGINLKDKIIYAHKGFFNRASYKTYRENSLEVFKIATTKPYIQAIEIDVRKSKDGILYCYHGNIFDYIFILRLPFSFSFLRKRFQADTLKDILAIISEDKIIVLDIKDTKVTKEDILAAVAGKKFPEVIIGNKSVGYHRKLHDLPKEFVKMLNGNPFSAFYDFKKLRAAGFKYIEIVFPFLATRKILQKIKESGLEFVGFPAAIFWSKNQYLRYMQKYNLPYLPAYFIENW